MSFSKEKERSKIKNVVALYNMTVNLFWSALNLVPISIFCYRHISLKLFFTFSVISLLIIFLPQSFFNNIQLGKTTSVYKKIGVDFINKFTQNGKMINNFIRKKYPQYKVVSGNKRSMKKLFKSNLYVREVSFHDVFNFHFYYGVCFTKELLVVGFNHFSE